MKIRPTIGLIALLAALVSVAAPVWARPPTPPPGLQQPPPPVVPTVCATTDVSIGGIDATSCLYYPPVQNDSESLLNSSAFAGIATWDQQWRTGEGDKSAGGTLQLSLLNLDVGAGTVDLGWTGGPATADIAIVVKAAAEFHAYFFDDLLFGTPSGSFDVEYLVQIFNNNGGRQGLSHLSIYTTNVEPVIITSDCSLTSQGCGSVPAPAPIALIGIGLLGLAFGARRRRN